VLVCGSRKWSSRPTIEREIRALGPNVLIAHGDCRGADKVAASIAESLKLQVLAFPADWETYGKSAGPIRNRRMLTSVEPVLVLAFHNDIENSRGTKDMVGFAKACGVPVRVVTCEVQQEGRRVILKSKYPGWCNRCNKAFPVGEEIDWDKERAEKTLCMACSKAGPGDAEAPLPGVKLDAEDLGF
jgi:hypothetical protein